MKAPDISINVCAYNGVHLLPQALTCLTEQETSGAFTFELVVIDDDSTDGTGEFLTEFQARTSVPVRILHGGGKGVSHARNIGADASSGEWIAWFDQDQLAETTWLKELYSTACQTGADLVDGPRDLLLPKEELVRLSQFHRMCLGELSKGDTVHENVRRYASCTGNAIVRKSAFLETGGFDESILDGWEDWDYIRRHKSKGFSCWYAPKALVHHVVPPDRMSEDFFKWHAARLGIAFASRDKSEWGLPRTLFAGLARIAQAILIHTPILAWAYVTRNNDIVVERACLILRAVAYVRKTLFFLAPRAFCQKRFHERLQLRSEARYKRGDSDPAKGI